MRGWLCFGGGLRAPALILAALLLGPAAAADTDQVLSKIEQQLSGEAAGAPAQNQLALQMFYAARGFEPVWLEDGRPGERATALVDGLGRAREHGLVPEDYGAPQLATLLGMNGAERRAELDVSLSRAVLRYGNDLAAGRLKPAEVDSELFIQPQEVDPLDLLRRAAEAPDISLFLEGLAPDTPQYRRLRTALAAYRGIAAAGGWGEVDGGETLKAGMTDPRVRQLRARLSKGGYKVPETTEPDLFDADLERIVKDFQYNHGLATDGAVGKATIAALDTPVEERIAQMELNMERRRWMPDDLGAKYVFVNMADFEVKVVSGKKTVHVARVIVGKPYFRTPVFSAEMSYLVLNPYWHITPSIARNEILPQIQKKIGYLAEKRIRVFSDWSADAKEIDPAAVDWSKVTRAGFRYKLRQDSGAENALGRVKFMFPNRHNIYLHDTPAKELFNRTVRSFSHGCIRVQHPLELARLLLEPQGGWPRERIDAVVASGQQKVVRLAEPIPVHLTYLTAWANKDGSIHFRADIYGRDARLAAARSRR